MAMITYGERVVQISRYSTYPGSITRYLSRRISVHFERRFSLEHVIGDWCRGEGKGAFRGVVPIFEAALDVTSIRQTV